MAVIERRESVRNMPAFSMRLTRENKARLEETAYQLRISMGKLTERFVLEGISRLEAEGKVDLTPENRPA